MLTSVEQGLTMTDNEVNKIIAEYMGWQFFTPMNEKYKKLWVHESRIKDISKQSYVLEEYLFNKHKMLTEYEFKNYYIKSLDNLVPVWDKMAKDIRFWGGIMIYSCIVQGAKQSFDIESNNQDNLHLETSSEDKETIQQAASYATAKAIQEITKNVD